jgi:ferrous iron transport protein B
MKRITGKKRKPKRILLMGNPNVGKSVMFSRLTGANVIASNYAGTTIDFTKGIMRVEGERHEVIDVPGTYSLTPTNQAEKVATKMFHRSGEYLVNIVDSTNLERNLFLTLELLEHNIPAIIALNMWDDTEHKGISINIEKLEDLLGVPVVSTVGLTGEGIKNLIGRFKDARRSTTIKPMDDDQRWQTVGNIIKKVQKVEHRHHTLKETLADATIKPSTGIPLAFGIIILIFIIIRFIGEGLITFVFDPIFELYRPIVMRLSDALGSEGLIHDILVGDLIDGEINFLESMGLFSTGLYVPFAMVLPYIIAFYLVLSFLEDIGYLPRLAVLVDNVFHKLGIHGHGIVSVFLGLGCNVPGALSTRVLDTRKQRFISATLLAIAVPCVAQTAMIFGILGRHGIQYVALVFICLAIIYITVGYILNKMIKGESPEIFLELPPYRRPSLEALLKKTWMRVRWFLLDAVPFMFLGVFIISILYVTGIIEALGTVFAPITEGLFGLDRDATGALLVGFLRKDVAVGMLLPLNMSPMQLVIASTILTIYFPCIATFMVLLKELGIKDMIKATGLMIVVTLTVGTVMRIILLGI